MNFLSCRLKKRSQKPHIRFSTAKRWCRYAILFLVGTVLNACATEPVVPASNRSTLDPQGPGAAKLAELWWVMFGFGTFIFVLVTVLLIAALMRKRRATSETQPEMTSDVGRNWVIWGGIALPLVILAIVFGYNLYTLAAVTAPQDPVMTIKVIGRRWWWEVQYPNDGITTANELHIPVGMPVKVVLQTADVIHSFWVPRLHGKVDLIPERINDIVIQADKADVYGGECAEYCGLQHAHMNFMVVAQNDADFKAWISAQQKPSTPPADDPAKRGQQVFLDAKCAVCHVVKGLDDSSVDASDVDLGPDLTHLFSRLTIAGATLTNNRESLANWITNAQHVKPGSLMPNTTLNNDDLQALITYLETLQ